jgi:3'(2'), 5'-bisphosphate nucleotidase
MPPSAADLIEQLSLIASRAAAAILAVADPAHTRRDKPDHSPVTAADEAAEAVILDGLHGLAPQIPVVSEESIAQRKAIGPGERYFLVDPLDGTREFLAGLDEYTVNIALVEDHAPVIGVIAAPARGLLWRGAPQHGAERLTLPPGHHPSTARQRTPIRGRARPPAELRVMLSRSHPDAATDHYLAGLAQAERMRCGSSLKFCLLAEGTADLYPRLSPTSQWDIAAGHALLVAAGGAMLAPDGGVLRYDASGADFLMRGFIAWADGAAAGRSA